MNKSQIPYSPDTKAQWSLANYACLDCQARQPMLFMVKAELWLAAGFQYPGESRMDGIVCVSCFEQRIKRPLAAEDLIPNHPINTIITFGIKLGLASAKLPVNGKAINYYWSGYEQGITGTERNSAEALLVALLESDNK